MIITWKLLSRENFVSKLESGWSDRKCRCHSHFIKLAGIAIAQLICTRDASQLNAHTTHPINLIYVLIRFSLRFFLLLLLPLLKSFVGKKTTISPYQHFRDWHFIHASTSLSLSWQQLHSGYRLFIAKIVYLHLIFAFELFAGFSICVVVGVVANMTNIE